MVRRREQGAAGGPRRTGAGRRTREAESIAVLVPGSDTSLDTYD
ncbi:hypothetical protein [Streptomyces deserti]